MNACAVHISDLKPVFEHHFIMEKSGGDPERVKSLAREAAAIASGSGAAILAPLEFPGYEQVKVGDKTFQTPLLSERLAGHARVFPYIATEGKELAAWGQSFRDTSDTAIVHIIRQIAVKACEQAIEASLCEKFDIPVLSSLNPGSLRSWPITDQTHLLQLLAPVPERLGVSLLPNNIMQPDYTISGIFYQTGEKIYNCQLCPRENCPNRKAPRDK